MIIEPNAFHIWTVLLEKHSYKITKKIEVYPFEKEKWSIDQIIIFIKILSKKYIYKRSNVPKNHSQTIIFGFKNIFWEKELLGEKNVWLFHFDLYNNIFRVFIKKDFLPDLSFNQFYITERTNIGSRKRSKKNLSNSNFLYYSKLYISNEFQPTMENLIKEHKNISYVNKVIKKSLKKNKISDFLDFELKKFSDFSDLIPKSLEDLKNNINGKMILFAQFEKIHKKQFKLFINNKNHFISKIIWISPYFISILSSNKIRCLVYDSNFYSCSPYALCIPCAIIENSSVPLGFSFGPSENVDLYTDIYLKMSEICDLSKIPILIDMGKPLVKFAKIHNQNYFFCHRHILENIGSNSFILPIIKLLITLDSELIISEIYNSCSIYLNTIIEDGENLNMKNEYLLKIGLEFKMKRIKISDKHKYSRFSLLYRKPMGIPTTSNHLESIHGHLNYITPRKKNFFRLVNNLMLFITNSTLNVNKKISKNYHKRIQKVSKLFEVMDKIVIKEETDVFFSKIESCCCGDSFKENTLFDEYIPCIHQIFLGKKIPEKINFHKYNFSKSSTNLFELILVETTLFAKPGRKTKKNISINTFYCCKTSLIKFLEETIDQIIFYSSFTKREIIAQKIILRCAEMNGNIESVEKRNLIFLLSLRDINQIYKI